MVTAHLLWLAIRQGKAKVINEITSGQYQRPNGIGFGGFAPEWSNQTLHKIVADNLSDAKRVAVIDWHTGIGSYGDSFFLCFDDPVSPEFARARDWWGEAVGDDASGYDGDERPDYQGLLIKSIRDQLQLLGASTTAAVIEFGTFSNQKMLEALLIDRWIRCEGGQLDDSTRAAHIKEVRHRFCPDDPKWRESVIRQGYLILNQTMQGMANWGQCDE